MTFFRTSSLLSFWYLLIVSQQRLTNTTNKKKCQPTEGRGLTPLQGALHHLRRLGDLFLETALSGRGSPGKPGGGGAFVIVRLFQREKRGYDSLKNLASLDYLT